MQDQEEKTLDDYIITEFASLGREQVSELLKADIEIKRYRRESREYQKVMSINLASAVLVPLLGPPFVPGILHSGASVAEIAKRPFKGGLSSREASIRASLMPGNFYFHQDVLNYGGR